MPKQKKCKTCKMTFKCLAQKTIFNVKEEFCVRCENRLKCVTTDSFLCLDFDFNTNINRKLADDSFITYKPIGGWKQTRCIKGNGVTIAVKA